MTLTAADFAPNPQSTLQSRYQLGETLGEGTYGKVKQAVHLPTNNLVAIKIVLRKIANPTHLNREIIIHQSIKHDRIIQLWETIEDKNHVYLVLELAQGGELFDKITPDIGVKDCVAHFYFSQLLAGVKHIHSLGIAHRDLKPENLLLDDEGNLKITDFGCATCFLYQGKRRTLATACGTPPYSAPEIVTQNYNESVDIWSCGIILFVLLIGNTPWDEPTTRCPEFRRYTSSDIPLFPPWNRLEPSVRSFLQHLLDVCVETRYTISEIENSSWFNQSNSLLSEGKCADQIALATMLMSTMAISEPKPGITDQEVSASEEYSEYALSQPAVYGKDSELSRGPDLIECFSQPSYEAMMLTQPPPTTLSQRRQQFSDLVPSSRLTRFYSRYPISLILDRLDFTLGEYLVPHKTNRENHTITFSTVDKRKCPLIGEIRIQMLHHSEVALTAPSPIRAHEAKGVALVNFRKGKGDPIEFKRIFMSLRNALSEMVTLEKGLSFGFGG